MKPLGLHDIPLNAIDSSFRLRPVDDAYAAMMAESIAGTGTDLPPIEVGRVRDGYRLIAGGHRLAALRMLNRETVSAFVFEGTAEEFRLREIDENLIRHELNPLDRATFLAERKSLYEKLHPSARQGGAPGRAGGGKAKGETVSGFARETAERTNLNERTIQMAVMIAGRLSPDVKAAIAGTPIAKVQKELLALAKRSPVEQRAILGLLLGEKPQAKSVREAVALLTNRPTKAPDGYARLLTAWRHAGTAERASFIEFLRLDGALANAAKAAPEAASEAARETDDSDGEDA